MPSFVIIFSLVMAVTALPAERIIGGSQASIDDHRYVAALLRSPTLTGYRIQCGGVVISSRVVLTAASCLVGDPVARWRTRVGTALANTTQQYYTQAIRTHAAYDPTTRENDIAALRITMTFPVYGSSPIVRIATLAPAGYSIPLNDRVTAVGWGATEIGGSAQDVLHEIQLRAVGQTACELAYRLRGHRVKSTMVCASTLGTRGQCTGDEGSPLVHNGTVVGVFSWGHQCVQPLLPGVSTRLSEYTQWIMASRSY